MRSVASCVAMIGRLCCARCLLLLAVFTPGVALAASSNLLIPDAPLSSTLGVGTHVVMLGTGTPVPDHMRSGPSVAVIHNSRAYIFDTGGGMVQRAVEANERLGIGELDPIRIGHVFFTHLHSDHVLDYVELASTLWWRRLEKLQAWGPNGLADMTSAMYEMMARDRAMRIDGSQPVTHPDNYRVVITEIQPGVIFREQDLVVEAFAVPHGEVKPAFGYKITTSDRSIVISGDTSYSETLLAKARGVDVLVHEVISDAGLAKLSEFWQTYHRRTHTTSAELAKLASVAKPGVLVLTHLLLYGETAASVLDEVRMGYSGRVELAHDLDVY